MATASRGNLKAKTRHFLHGFVCGDLANHKDVRSLVRVYEEEGLWYLIFKDVDSVSNIYCEFKSHEGRKLKTDSKSRMDNFKQILKSFEKEGLLEKVGCGTERRKQFLKYEIRSNELKQSVVESYNHVRGPDMTLQLESNEVSNDVLSSSELSSDAADSHSHAPQATMTNNQEYVNTFVENGSTPGSVNLSCQFHPEYQAVALTNTSEDFQVTDPCSSICGDQNWSLEFADLSPATKKVIFPFEDDLLFDTQMISEPEVDQISALISESENSSHHLQSAFISFQNMQVADPEKTPSSFSDLDNGEELSQLSDQFNDQTISSLSQSESSRRPIDTPTDFLEFEVEATSINSLAESMREMVPNVNKMEERQLSNYIEPVGAVDNSVSLVISPDYSPLEGGSSFIIRANQDLPSGNYIVRFRDYGNRRASGHGGNHLDGLENIPAARRRGTHCIRVDVWKETGESMGDFSFQYKDYSVVAILNMLKNESSKSSGGSDRPYKNNKGLKQHYTKPYGDYGNHKGSYQNMKSYRLDMPVLMCLCDEMAKTGDASFFNALQKLGVIVNVLNERSEYYRDFAVTAEEYGHVELAGKIAMWSRKCSFDHDMGTLTVRMLLEAVQVERSLVNSGNGFSSDSDDDTNSSSSGYYGDLDSEDEELSTNGRLEENNVNSDAAFDSCNLRDNVDDDIATHAKVEESSVDDDAEICEPGSTSCTKFLSANGNREENCVNCDATLHGCYVPNCVGVIWFVRFLNLCYAIYGSYENSTNSNVEESNVGNDEKICEPFGSVELMDLMDDRILMRDPLKGLTAFTYRTSFIETLISLWRSADCSQVSFFKLTDELGPLEEPSISIWTAVCLQDGDFLHPTKCYSIYHGLRTPNLETELKTMRGQVMKQNHDATKERLEREKKIRRARKKVAEHFKVSEDSLSISCNIVKKKIYHHFKNRLRFGWKRLGMELIVPDEKIDSSKSNFLEKKSFHPVLDLLDHWIELYGEDASVEKLLSALVKCRHSNLALKLVNTLNRWDHDEGNKNHLMTTEHAIEDENSFWNEYRILKSKYKWDKRSQQELRSHCLFNLEIGYGVLALRSVNDSLHVVKGTGTLIITRFTIRSHYALTFLQIVLGNEIDRKIVDEYCPDWDKVWAELSEKVINSTSQNPEALKKICFSSALTSGDVVTRDYNCGVDHLFQSAIIANKCSGPFLENGSSSISVIFCDMERLSQVYACSKCKVNKLTLRLQHVVNKFNDKGGDASNVWSDEDLIEWLYEEKVESKGESK